MSKEIPPAGTPVDQRTYNEACRKIMELETTLKDQIRRKREGHARQQQRIDELQSQIASLRGVTYTKWRHYKGGIYELIVQGKLEATEQAVVIYRDTSDQVWVRPLAEWAKKFQLLIDKEGV